MASFIHPDCHARTLPRSVAIAAMTSHRQKKRVIGEREGRPDGKHLDHWLRAAAELIAATERQAGPSSRTAKY
jgi:hypothetical protein